MQKIIHPYVRYAQALIMVSAKLESVDSIKKEIEKSLDYFYLKPDELPDGKEKIKYEFVKATDAKAFLSPHIITVESKAKDLYGSIDKHVVNKILDGCFCTKDLYGSIDKISENQKKSNSQKIQRWMIPTSGEFLSFSTTIGRCLPKSTLENALLGLVTTLTADKPSFRNACIIPDLPLKDMKDFISIFQRIKSQKCDSSKFLYGKVVNRKPQRPYIFNGNFPNPPASNALGGIALLAAIGEFAKEGENSDLAKNVLEKLKQCPIYLIEYNSVDIFTYNNHIVDLARDGKLSEIVRGIYDINIYNKSEQNRYKDPEYQKLDMFFARFLTVFTHPYFRDFLSVRAEYPSSLLILFKTYFQKMEKIEEKVVVSAESLGQWLNRIAYITAKREQDDNRDQEENRDSRKEKIFKLKSKVLIDLESMIFSAKSSLALIAQITSRAGRLSNMDAPAESAYYIEKTLTGDLTLEQAKYLLVAFLRLKSKEDVNLKEISEDDFISD